MEVHHHHSSPRRHFKHYLFDTFMLVFAISLSFFMENEREHFLDRKREKRYMQMLIPDLENDIIKVDSNDISRKDREQKLDSLLKILGQKNPVEHVADLYRLALTTDGYETFNRNDRTIAQLKTAGAMRIIRKDSVSEGIIDYDNYIIDEVDWTNRTEAERINYYKQLRYQFFDAQVMNVLSKNESMIDKINTPLLPAGPIVVNSIAGAVFQMIRISETNRDNEQIVKLKAMNLLGIIRRQYHIEEKSH